MNSPSQPDHWIGRSIGDRQRYRLEKRLGGGGMGDVFLAIDIILGKQVALKLLKDTLAESGELRKRFEREVAVSAALKSDHIVEVSDYGVTAEGYPFYVMEYLRGQSLGQLMRREGPLKIDRTISIITQICQGLQLAHQGVSLWRDGATSNGNIKVVHRDLKPDNIFLVPTALGELVKILDFGIAKIREDSVQNTNLTTTFIGTFRYAAPEQLGVAKDLDGRADIYSLGVILYELISGVDPFGFGKKARTTGGVLWAMAHNSKPPVPLRSQPGCENLSSQLEEVVMRCLQKSPAQRFASVVELGEALQAAAISGTSSTDMPQVLSPFSHGSNDNTVRRPLVVESAVPDSTITQIPQLLDPNIPEATIAQSPTKSTEVSDTTIAQSPTKPTVISRPITQTEKVDPNTNSQITSPEPSFRSLSKNFLLPLGVGITIGLALLGAIFAYIQSRPGETQVWDDIKNLNTQAKYKECATQAETVAQNSSYYNEAQTLLNKCRLKYAKKLASEKKFDAAIAAAKKIPKTSPLYREAKKLIKDWTEI